MVLPPCFGWQAVSWLFLRVLQHISIQAKQVYQQLGRETSGSKISRNFEHGVSMHIVPVCRMRTWRFILLLVLVSNPLSAAESYFGEVDAGILLRVEDDASGIIYLQVSSVDRQGHSQTLLPPLYMKPIAENGHTYEAVGFVHGESVPIRLSVAGDGATLKWLQPAQIKLANGSPVQIAGNHRQLSEGDRQAAAERHFKLADQRLNDAYRQLRSRLSTEDFTELQGNQRRWLKFRDHFIADDDDTAVNGPGSVPYMQVQTMRTLERTAFLQAVQMPLSSGHICGRYSDGIDWELRLCEVPLSGHHLFFFLKYRNHDLQRRDWPEPTWVAGCATPTGNGHSWTITSKGNNIDTEKAAEGALLLLLSDDRKSVMVSRAVHPPFNTRLYRIAELTPAEEPMRTILLRMPASIFDNTTEGLSENDRAQLLLTGAAGPFQLQEPGMDFVQVLYSEGEVALRRFPRADGGAVIAVATTNGRARSFELWLRSTEKEIPVLWPPKLALPQLGMTDFFSEAQSMPTTAQGLLDFSLREDLAEIRVTWVGPSDGPQPDYAVDLIWDGYGFGAVRSAIME